jgi:hypothetical protein
MYYIACLLVLLLSIGTSVPVVGSSYESSVLILCRPRYRLGFSPCWRVRRPSPGSGFLSAYCMMDPVGLLSVI